MDMAEFTKLPLAQSLAGMGMLRDTRTAVDSWEMGDLTQPNACFAAGTMVHTDKGLMPIEQVRVGTRVLAQPELGGGRDYRRVTNTTIGSGLPSCKTKCIANKSV